MTVKYRCRPSADRMQASDDRCFVCRIELARQLMPMPYIVMINECNVITRAFPHGHVSASVGTSGVVFGWEVGDAATSQNVSGPIRRAVINNEQLQVEAGADAHLTENRIKRSRYGSLRVVRSEYDRDFRHGSRVPRAAACCQIFLTGDTNSSQSRRNRASEHSQSLQSTHRLTFHVRL